jgi:acetyl-CoA C-acetyltransferase
LIGDGHPVGATGVRQVAAAFTQLTGKAARARIDGAERFLTCNIGGSVRTSVEVVWEAF